MFSTSFYSTLLIFNFQKRLTKLKYIAETGTRDRTLQKAEESYPGLGELVDELGIKGSQTFSFQNSHLAEATHFQAMVQNLEFGAVFLWVKRLVGTVHPGMRKGHRAFVAHKNLAKTKIFEGPSYWPKILVRSDENEKSIENLGGRANSCMSYRLQNYKSIQMEALDSHQNH